MRQHGSDMGFGAMGEISAPATLHPLMGFELSAPPEAIVIGVSTGGPETGGASVGGTTACAVLCSSATLVTSDTSDLENIP